MDVSKWAVLASGRRIEEAQNIWEKTVLPVLEWPQSVDEGGGCLKKLYDAGRRGFIVFGGDELVGRVVTAYWRRRKLGKHPLRLWPLEVGEDCYVAQRVGKASEPKKAARLTTKKQLSWKRERVGTLKVTASTEPAAWYGFSFGCGWVYRVAEERKRARGGARNLVAAAGRLMRDTVVDDGEGQLALRVAVDHRPGQNKQGSMVASTLANTYFGLGAQGDGAVLWEELGTGELMRKAVTPEAVRRFREGGRAFDCVHLDAPEGWVLDGRLHGELDSGVVQVAPGPTVEVVWPQTSVVSRIRKLW